MLVVEVNKRRKILKTIAGNLLTYNIYIIFITSSCKSFRTVELSHCDCFRRYSEEHEEETNYGQTDDLAYFESALCEYRRSRLGAQGRRTDCWVQKIGGCFRWLIRPWLTSPSRTIVLLLKPPRIPFSRSLPLPFTRRLPWSWRHIRHRPTSYQSPDYPRYRPLASWQNRRWRDWILPSTPRCFSNRLDDDDDAGKPKRRERNVASCKARANQYIT